MSNDIPGINHLTQYRMVVWTIEEVRRRLGVQAGVLDLRADTVTLLAGTTETTISSSTVTSLTAVYLSPLNAAAAVPDWYISSRSPASRVVLTHSSGLDDRTYQCLLIG